MTPTVSRSRASTLQGSGPEVADCEIQLQALGKNNSKIEQDTAVEETHLKLRAAHAVRQFLLEDLSTIPHARDTFRHLNGFQTLIIALNSVAQTWAHQEEVNNELHFLLGSLLQAIFGILAAALQDHKGNQQYFRQHIEGGGWVAIKDILYATLSNSGEAVSSRRGDLTERVFGCLLACALNDESLTGFFKRLNRLLDKAVRPPDVPEAAKTNNTATQDTETSAESQIVQPTDRLYAVLKKEISFLARIHHQDVVLLMFDLWKNLGDIGTTSSIPLEAARTIGVIPSIIHHLANLSISNLVALHCSGLVGSALLSLLGLSRSEACPGSELRNLVASLLKLGVADLHDAHLLLRNARFLPCIAELLLMSLRSSRSPSYIHFDLSLNGFSSVELPGIGRAFPPTGSSTGYTFSLWFQMTRFDPNAHTTIFGAFDASQTCFVLVYLEKDTRNLILQTSVSSSRPSVRFKSTSFNEGRWYHVVVAHRRPKTTSSSRASLFVNGEFVEQVKSQYPAVPPSTVVKNPGVPSPSNRRPGTIQAFIGTPQDLATHLGKGLVHTEWRLASAQLFADVLSDDLVAVYFELGPRYTGNYQDCLGSFQTYRASAALNLRNESLHPGKEEKSEIVTAIRSKASTLLPETNVLLNISANLVLDDDDNNNIDETHLLRFISKAAGKNLRNVTRGGRNALAINGAIPSINEALLHSSGFAVVTGDPAVVVPRSLDDVIWSVGGCAGVGLALLEAAEGPDDTLRALNILLESIQENWRNSEAMERESGFGVLSTLLSVKLGQQMPAATKENALTQITKICQPTESSLALQVLTTVLKFLGYCTERPEDSVIINPLAYRILLVDMEYWRSSEPLVQKCYYEQFIVFGVRSKNHLFNSKRLARMR